MRLRTFAVCLLSLILAGCLRIHNSPAPGCVRTIGLAPLGGCFGTTIIRDLTVTPETQCLTIRANNCNGGVLELDNRCAAPLALGGMEIAPAESRSADIAVEGDRIRLQETQGNFAAYEPTADIEVTLSGELGDQQIKVTFIKTAPLCDPG
jgi:hypothetical protein